jgi:hypothetical protein
MVLSVKTPETSARVFDHSSSVFGGVVGAVGSMLGAVVGRPAPMLDAGVSRRFGATLDAIAAALTRHAATQAIIEAMTPKAKEFLFLAAVFIAAIVARIASRCSANLRQPASSMGEAAVAAAPLAACSVRYAPQLRRLKEEGLAKPCVHGPVKPSWRNEQLSKQLKEEATWSCLD